MELASFVIINLGVNAVEVIMHLWNEFKWRFVAISPQFSWKLE